MQSELELLRTLVKAEEDVVNGRVEPIQNTFDDIRKLLLERQRFQIFNITEAGLSSSDYRKA